MKVMLYVTVPKGQLGISKQSVAIFCLFVGDIYTVNSLQGVPIGSMIGWLDFLMTRVAA